MFKKIISIILVAASVFCLIACGMGSDKSSKKTNKKDDINLNHDSIEELISESVSSQNEIDPFEGLEVNFFGISPFCTITINNSGCSKEAQMYIDYVYDGEYFANGDVVVVKASLNTENGYSIKENCEEASFTVTGMPYYADSLDGIDTTALQNELNDFITSQISFDSSYTVFGANAWNFLDTYGTGGNNWCHFFNVISVKSNEAHLLTLKERKVNDYLTGEGDLGFYNSLRIVVTCKAEASHQNSNSQWYANGDIFVCINIDNLVVYPDGSFGWGLSSPESCEFTYASSLAGVESTRTVNVTSYSEYYNINVLNKNDWINVQ